MSLTPLLLGAALTAHAGPRPIDLIWDASSTVWHGAEMRRATPGTKIRVNVENPDPLTRYTLSVEYREPVKWALDGFGAALGGGVGPSGRVESAWRPLTAGKSHDDKALTQVKRLRAANQRVHVGLARLFDRSAVFGGAEPDALVSQMRQDLDRALSNYQEGIKGGYAKDEGVESRALLLREVIRQVELWRKETRRSPMPFTVSSGFGSVDVRVCQQSLTWTPGSKAYSLAVSRASCSSVKVLDVADPLGPISTSASVMIPFPVVEQSGFALQDAVNAEGDPFVELVEYQSQTIRPEPVVTVGVHHSFPSRAAWRWGGEVSLSVGPRLGRLYGAGTYVAAGPVSVGTGLFLDVAGRSRAIPEVTTGSLDQRTEAVPSYGWYLRIGMNGSAIKRGVDGPRRPGDDECADGAPPPCGERKIVIRADDLLPDREEELPEKIPIPPPPVEIHPNTSGEVTSTGGHIPGSEQWANPGFDYTAWTMETGPETKRILLGQFLAFPSAYVPDPPEPFERGYDHVRWLDEMWPAAFTMRARTYGLGEEASANDWEDYTACEFDTQLESYSGPKGPGTTIYRIREWPGGPEVGWLRVSDGEMRWFALPQHIEDGLLNGSEYFLESDAPPGGGAQIYRRCDAATPN